MMKNICPFLFLKPRRRPIEMDRFKKTLNKSTRGCLGRLGRDITGDKMQPIWDEDKINESMCIDIKTFEFDC